MNYYSNAYAMNYIFKKNLLEVGFKTREEQSEAINKEIIFNGSKLYIQKLHHITDVITVIKATNVNLADTVEETKILIQSKMEQYGEIKDIFIPLVNNRFQEPEATIFIKVNEFPPREIELEGAKMLLNWKGATPRCRFCKRSNHLVKDCKNLKRKIENQKIKEMQELAKEELAITESTKDKNNSKKEIQDATTSMSDSEVESCQPKTKISRVETESTDEIVTAQIEKNNSTPTNWYDEVEMDELTSLSPPIPEPKEFTGKISILKIKKESSLKPKNSLFGLSKSQRLAAKKGNTKVAEHNDPFAPSGYADV